MRSLLIALVLVLVPVASVAADGPQPALPPAPSVRELVVRPPNLGIADNTGEPLFSGDSGYLV